MQSTDAQCEMAIM